MNWRTLAARMEAAGATLTVETPDGAVLRIGPDPERARVVVKTPAALAAPYRSSYRIDGSVVGIVGTGPSVDLLEIAERPASGAIACRPDSRLRAHMSLLTQTWEASYAF